MIRTNHGETFDSGLAYYHACLIPILQEGACYDVSWDTHPDALHSYQPVPDCQQSTVRFVGPDNRYLSGVVRVVARLDSVDGQCPEGSDPRFTFSIPGRAFCVTDV